MRRERWRRKRGVAGKGAPRPGPLRFLHPWPGEGSAAASTRVARGMGSGATACFVSVSAPAAGRSPAGSDFSYVIEQQRLVEGATHDVSGAEGIVPSLPAA
jgi:hypothetical protein